MERKAFLKLSGMAGGAALLPWTNILAGGAESNVCTLMPSETEGPFPYPGGELTNPLNIIDIRGGQPGVSLELTFTCVDSVTCAPLENVRVDIWHCNKDGDYSGYAAFAGQFWLRGYQFTNVNGQAMFTTIYPGWYPGRATHIHIEMFYNNTMILTSQVAFDEAISNVVHVSPLYAASGINTTTNMQDGILGNTPQELALEMLTVTGDTVNGYVGTIQMAFQGVPTGIKNEGIEPGITVYPNPVTNKLLISHFVADASSTVKVLDLKGKVIATGKLKTGASSTTFDVGMIANGVYMLVLENNSGKQIIKFVKN